MKKIVFTLALVLAVTWTTAQGPPPPPPLQPLVAPTAPAGNAVTTDKASLGKVLFWDEQLSSTRTVSCGTCHQPVSGGSDPRSLAGVTDHPGADGVLGTADDITGSPGVILNHADGTYEVADYFGLAVQTTRRYAPSAINAGYSEELFWDGRAGETFVDPVSGNTVLAAGAALESQVAGPPTSSVEMAHQGRDWEEIAERIANVKPLAISPDIPTDLETWIADRSYGELFTQTFGSDGVTPARIIMAIATYERTLVSNQAPFDDFIAGNQNSLTQQERQGLALFAQNDCTTCHGGNRLTDDQFHYIGVRPQNDDLGRFNVTGNNPDRGRMRTPTLRNVELRGEFMHNGRLQSLEEVVDFYDRGGDFEAPNKNNNVRPLNLTETEKAALVAFLGRPLTDPRVAAEIGVFSRPVLFADSPLVPVIESDGDVGDDGETPQMIANEPSLAGNPNFTVALDATGANQTVYLAINTAPIPSGTIPSADDVLILLEQTTDDDGHVSVPLSIPNGDAMVGARLYGKWFVTDNAGLDAESPSFSAVVFGESAGLLEAPVNLTGTFSENSGTVSLNWDVVETAETYEIFRSSTDQFLDAIRLGSSSTNSYSDDSVATDQTYHYWVFAVNAHEAGFASEETAVSTLGLSGFTLNATDGTSTEQTLLSWSSQGPPITYEVLRGLESDPTTMSLIASDLSGLSYEDTTGDAARTYYYRVVAKSGGTVFSNSEVVVGSRALAAPTNVSATFATLDDRIQISWAAEDEADSYAIYRGTFGAARTLLTSTGSSIFDDYDVTAATDYFYTIVSVNASGQSEHSTLATGYKQVQAPTEISASYVTFADRIVVSWSPAETVDSYIVYRSSTNSFSDAVELGRIGNASSFTDTSEASGVDYTYWVASVDEDNNPIVNQADGVLGLSADTVPDSMIGKNTGSLRGDNIYNTTGAGQQHNASSKRYRTVKAVIAIQNDGSVSDTFSYSSSGKGRSFDLKYLRISPAPANLTAGIKTSSATSASLAPGTGEQITVKASPKRSRTRGSSRTVRYGGLITSVSTTNSSKVDCVKLKVTSSE